jgi:hypothetical protein
VAPPVRHERLSVCEARVGFKIGYSAANVSKMHKSIKN